MIPLQEEKMPIETKQNSEWPEREAVPWTEGEVFTGDVSLSLTEQQRSKEWL